MGRKRKAGKIIELKEVTKSCPKKNMRGVGRPKKCETPKIQSDCDWIDYTESNDESSQKSQKITKQPKKLKKQHDQLRKTPPTNKRREIKSNSHEWNDITSKKLKPKSLQLTTKSVNLHSFYFANEWFKQNVFNNPILLQFKASNIKISNIDHSQYLPEKHKSPSFSFNCHVSDRKTEFSFLELFESMDIEFPLNISHVIYCGGPIWGLDWCPSAPYLAVAVHQKFNQLNDITEPSCPTKSVLQIWHFCSILKTSPSFKLGICHEYSPIFSLKFCPNNQTILSSESPRIGVLAFCGCDEFVRITSIPTPNQNLFYIHMELNAILKPFDDYKVLDSTVRYRAVCFDWHPKSPHNRIVVGYSDGHFSVFIIEPHLAVYTPGTTVEYYIPTVNIHALCSPINDIIWMPHADDLVIPVGYDVALSIYSINDIRYPVINNEKGSFMRVSFPPFSNILCAATEMRYPRLNHIRLFQLCHQKNKINKIPDDNSFGDDCIHKNSATIMDLKTCPYSGFVVSCDTDGYVQISNLNERFLKNREASYIDALAYQITYADSDSIENLRELPDWENNLSRLFDRGFIFNDYNNLQNDFQQIESKVVRNKCRPTEQAYLYEALSPFNPCAINRVAINPNKGALCYIASGGNTGLVRIQNICKWAEKTGEEFVKLN